MRKNICYCLFGALLCFVFSCKKKSEDHTFIPAGQGSTLPGQDTVRIFMLDTVKIRMNTAVNVPIAIFQSPVRVMITGLPAGISAAPSDTNITTNWKDTLIVKLKIDTITTAGTFPVNIKADPGSNDYIGPGSKVFYIMVQ